MRTVAGYLPLLLILVACPLMMILMMRGMNGGHGMGKDQDPHRKTRAPGTDLRADQRIRDLERRVAELQAERDLTGSTTRRP